MEIVTLRQFARDYRISPFRLLWWPVVRYGPRLRITRTGLGYRRDEFDAFIKSTDRPPL